MRWRGIDNGREGFLGRERWYAVLQIISRHEGERHTDLSSPVFDELSMRFPDEEWRGKNGNRSFFRDYAAAWVNMGVLRPMAESDQLFELTDTGRRLAQSPAAVIEFFRGYLDEYLEVATLAHGTLSWSPFEAISGALAAHAAIPTELLQQRSEAVARAYYPDLELTIPASSETNARRFRSYLKWLENAGAIQIERGRIVVIDHEYLESMVRLEVQVVSEEVEEGASSRELDEDNRRRTERTAVVREGQKRFSDLLKDAYDRTCCVTGTREENVLEAAHILPYMGRQSNSSRNGLLLAVDIHRLFDKFLLGVNPVTLRVELSSRITDDRYRSLNGVRISSPILGADQPYEFGLERRYVMYQEAQ